MRLTANDALALADAFGEASTQLRRWRFDHSDTLSNAKWDQISSLEWSLLNASEDMVTLAVGLKLDDIDGSLEQLKDVTAKAKKAVKTIKDVKKIIGIATALVVLAGAIISKDPNAIAKAAADVFTKVKDAIDDHNENNG